MPQEIDGAIGAIQRTITNGNQPSAKHIDDMAAAYESGTVGDRLLIHTFMSSKGLDAAFSKAVLGAGDYGRDDVSGLVRNSRVAERWGFPFEAQRLQKEVFGALYGELSVHKTQRPLTRGQSERPWMSIPAARAYAAPIFGSLKLFEETELETGNLKGSMLTMAKAFAARAAATKDEGLITVAAMLGEYAATIAGDADDVKDFHSETRKHAGPGRDVLKLFASMKANDAFKGVNFDELCATHVGNNP